MDLTILANVIKRRKDGAMDAIDDYFIDLFERISNRINQWIGVNNFSLSRICAFVLAVIDFAGNSSLMSNFFTSVAFVFLFAGSFGIENKLSSENQDIAIANPLKLVHKNLRKIPMLFFILHVLSPQISAARYFFSILVQILLVMYLYFICCDLKSPTKSWLRKKIESLTPVPALVPVPVRGE